VRRISSSRPITGGLGQVAAVLLEGFVSAFRVLVVHFLGSADRGDGILEFVGRGAGLREQLFAAAVIDGQGQQQMLDRDVAVAIALLEAVGLIEHAVEALAQIDVVWRRAQGRLAGDPGVDLLHQGAKIHAGLLEDATSEPLLGQQGGEQMLALHLLLTLLLRQLLRRHHGGPGLFGEQFGGGMHEGDLRWGGWLGVGEPYGDRLQPPSGRTEPDWAALLPWGGTPIRVAG
jgi:hypothetical protein